MRAGRVEVGEGFGVLGLEGDEGEGEGSEMEEI